MSIPRFKRSEGDIDHRVDTIEDHLGRNEQYALARDEAVNNGIRELERRMNAMDTWKIEVLLFIGASKIKWAAVVFASAGVSAALTAIVTKIMEQ